MDPWCLVVAISTWTDSTTFRYLPRAVGGGADAVGNIDAALPRDPGDETGLKALDSGRGSLEAVARGLPVRRGPRGVIERLHPGAAAFGERPHGAGVAEARHKERDHLATADRRVRPGGKKACQHERQEGTRASHGVAVLLLCVRLSSSLEAGRCAGKGLPWLCL
ncbi:hypothetical protein BHE74_00008335 [Ensete ventricosum]|nr:hypothetical protein BHE74_00008335 [Ensete ventricosum]